MQGLRGLGADGEGGTSLGGLARLILHASSSQARKRVNPCVAGCSPVHGTKAPPEADPLSLGTLEAKPGLPLPHSPPPLLAPPSF